MRPLIHIGYHKTATNWLQRIFFSDPETGYRWIGKKPKSHPVRRFVLDPPLAFDAAAVRAELEPMLAKVEADGLLPVISLERLSGHPLSGGFDSRLIADRLHEVFPGARILVAVREQRSAIVSIYKGYVQQGGAATLREFLEPPRSRSRRTSPFDSGFFEYDRLVSYYRGLYGEENVLCLALDQFIADGRAFVGRIGEFAGRPVPPEVLDRLPYTRRENVRAVSALTLDLTRRLNLLVPRSELNPTPVIRSKRVDRLARRLESSDGLNGRWTKGLAERREAELRRSVDRWVGDRYAESNGRLSELIGADLGVFGWTVV